MCSRLSFSVFGLGVWIGVQRRFGKLVLAKSIIPSSWSKEPVKGFYLSMIIAEINEHKGCSVVIWILAVPTIYGAVSQPQICLLSMEGKVRVITLKLHHQWSFDISVQANY